MTRLRLRNPRDEQGAVAILTAMLMVVLILLAAIVVDLGNARDNRRQSQNASDAASLAGANMLYPATGFCKPPSGGGAPVAAPCLTDAEDTARKYGTDNFQVSTAAWDACTVPAGSAPGMVPSLGTPCILFDSATPTLVRVYIPTRDVATFFGGIAGVSKIPVGSSAEAKFTPAVTCSLCFIGDMDAGNGDITVTGGNIAVGRDVTAGPNSVWNATSIGYARNWDNDVQHPGTPLVKIDPFGDPLASTSLPLNISNLVAKTDPCGATTATGGTGLYGSLSVGNNDTCNLLPGLYVISGSWTLGNQSLLKGTGVTLYVKGPNGYLHFKNGDAQFSAPVDWPVGSLPAVNSVPAGFAIIYDRDNTNAVELQGNGTTLIQGKVYAAGSKLDFNGTTCFGFSGGPFVFGSGYTNGNTACVTITNAKSTTLVAEYLHLSR